MNLHAGAVQAKRLHPDLDDALNLQPFEHPLQHAVFAPSVHPNVDCMPIPIVFRQCSPFAAVLRDIQYRVHQLEVRHAYVAALPRQVLFNSFVLVFRYFHAPIISHVGRFVNSVNKL